MRECHEAVAALLDAFSRGISIIKTQKSLRERERRQLDPSQKAAESQLKKSLKKSRTDVETAYGRDVARLGPGFAVGDAEARSSLSTILVRINAGFLSVIERFMRGCSSPTDYQALVNLSNSSRIEAIHTFEQLSQRLSRSSLVLASPRTPSAEATRRNSKSRTKPSNSTTKQQKHVRSKSAPELSLTPLGPATAAGWIRLKPRRKLSSESKSSSTSTNTSTSAIKRPSPKSSRRALPSSQTGSKQTTAPVYSHPRPHPHPQPNTFTPTRQSPSSHPSHPSHLSHSASHPHPPQPHFQASPYPPHASALTHTPSPKNRHSLLSFASDSTKLGEIPPHKWTRPAMFETDEAQFPILPYYPLTPYRPPEKTGVGSRLRKMFRRG